MSVVTARSSASRTARPNPSSSNAKTPAASPGPSYSEDNIRRVSQRYSPPLTTSQSFPVHTRIYINRTQTISMLTSLSTTGSRKEALPPHHQAPTRHRRRLPRRNQRAPQPTPRSARSGPQGGHRSRQGEAHSGSECKEDGEGQERSECGEGTD
jgi:hypothetical protein